MAAASLKVEVAAAFKVPVALTAAATFALLLEDPIVAVITYSLGLSKCSHVIGSHCFASSYNMYGHNHLPPF